MTPIDINFRRSCEIEFVTAKPSPFSICIYGIGAGELRDWNMAKAVAAEALRRRGIEPDDLVDGLFVIKELPRLKDGTRMRWK